MSLFFNLRLKNRTQIKMCLCTHWKSSIYAECRHLQIVGTGYQCDLPFMYNSDRTWSLTERDRPVLTSSSPKLALLSACSLITGCFLWLFLSIQWTWHSRMWLGAKVLVWYPGWNTEPFPTMSTLPTLIPQLCHWMLDKGHSLAIDCGMGFWKQYPMLFLQVPTLTDSFRPVARLLNV